MAHGARDRPPTPERGGPGRVPRVLGEAAASVGAAGGMTPQGVAPVRVLYIANRGEIAIRIARTAERLGIRAVRASLDGADAVDLLDPPSVILAAKAAGADALHP